ncbi:class I SAM-dependent methyltransferase [Arthrobacter gengyunqii]|uniref:Class I SAM-dependent methyltransferase n=1 Tax=Arthrobacter gengyunqii TaxID=2886940 RepID=A0A9X1M2S0_9MICC|nr:class I SAM-dependent methyltransferase [Arthrobacter gengyunqii]MCC3270288.1 class I SAM-dependent methyltransferase [Arthrobacter gengyunqii]UOY97486.1 class I SAM-dependent methyltransferase [Arthrobacter gengyunqii]
MVYGPWAAGLIGIRRGEDYYALPQLAQRYDADTQGRADLPFYLALVRELTPASVADVGAGTGLFCSLLAGSNVRLTITGVEPQQTMLDVARRQPLADRVQWIRGTAADLPRDSFGLLFMTGHVAQYFLDDAAWAEVLRQIVRSSVRQKTTMAGDLVTHVDEWTIGEQAFTTRETLRFPDDAAIHRGLDAACLAIECSWGNWDGSPVTAESPERIIMARTV